MATDKPEFVATVFDQIESQVQFGDNKASFLLSCVVPSGALAVTSLGLATISSAFVAASLTCALLAARPARIHDHPPNELFLLSYIARMQRDAFMQKYLDTSPSELVREALNSIHGKSVFATKKFRWIGRAVDLTLAGIGFMVAALVTAVIGLIYIGDAA